MQRECGIDTADEVRRVEKLRRAYQLSFLVNARVRYPRNGERRLSAK